MSEPVRVLDRIASTGIVPVVRAPSAALAVRAVEAILEGGIEVIELTMTVPGAVDVIGELTARFASRALIGAGTVIDLSTARSCVRAGAAFVVSPILEPALIACCRDEGVPAVPGALTPTEVVRASQAGAEVIKVFPCGAMGGPAYVKSLLAPFPHLRLMPTGGVSLKNVGEFLRAGAVALGVGADLVDVALLREGRADLVTQAARSYVEEVARARAGNG